MPEGQVDPEGLLIDQGTLARRFLLRPRGLRVSLSPCHKPRDQSAVMNEEEAGGIQEQGWQSPVSWQHTAGPGVEEWEAAGKTWRDEGSYKWLLLWAKYSISWSDKVLRLLFGFVFSGLVQCLSRSYRRRLQEEKERRNDRGSRLERLYSSIFLSCDDVLNGWRWDHVGRDLVLFLQPRLNYQSFGYDDVLATNLIIGI